MRAWLCLCSWGSEMQEIPAANSFLHPWKKGFLLKLTGKGWLYSGCWRKRFCVLDGTKFYFYEGEDAKGTDKSSGVISLDYYDLCEETSVKDKKNPHVFILGTSVRGFFDNRHQFASENEAEMKEWIHSVHDVIAEARNSRSRAGRNRNSGSGKESPDLSKSHYYSALMSENTVEGDLMTTENKLIIPNKDRARGPQGRRLPHRKSMMPSDSPSLSSDLRQRSFSLSTPEEEQEDDPEIHSTRLSVSMEAVDYDGKTIEGITSKRSSNSYEYDIPARNPIPVNLQDKEQNGRDGTTESIKPKKVSRFGIMGGQHAALTKELESKLKLGIGPGSRRPPVEDDNDSEPEKPNLEKKLESLDTKLDSVKSSVSELENKIVELSNECSSDKNRQLQLQIQEILDQAVSALKEVESTNIQCKQALAEVEQARGEQRKLLQECQNISNNVLNFDQIRSNES